jgi:hypothetical protein
MAQAIVSKLTYLARELTPGTRAAPNKYLAGANIRLLKNTTRGTVRPSGSLLSAGRPKIQDWGTWTLADGTYLDYNSLIYWLAAMLGVPTTSTPGGATNAREHAFLLDPSGANTRAIYTMASGYRSGTAEEALRCVMQAFSFGFSRNGAPTISGNGYGRNLNFSATLGVNEVNVVTITGSPTGGTFTITVNGQTTAGIAYNAAASAVQSALEALSNVAPGDVAVTGSAGGPYTLTWGGALANTDITISASGAGLTGGTTPAATATTTQGGGITTVPLKAIQAPEWDVFIDDTPGAIGTTQVDAYQAGFNFGGLTNPEWVINSALTSYKGDILQVPEVAMNLVLPNESAARTLLSSLDGGATKYVRFRAVGDEVESGQDYEFRIDCAVQGDENLGQFGDDGGAETIPFPLTVMTDSNFASGGLQALVRNAVTSI